MKRESIAWAGMIFGAFVGRSYSSWAATLVFMNIMLIFIISAEWTVRR